MHLQNDELLHKKRVHFEVVTLVKKTPNIGI